MKLFLIRHGETVDNIAGLYAGSRDSALTNHGVEQTKRLGAYFAEESIKLTHIFASPLTRAFMTAEAVLAKKKHDGTLEIVKVDALKERDFGRFEGKPYTSDEKSEGNDKKRKTGCELGGIETAASLAKRSDAFIDDFLLPLFATDGLEDEYIVAVVAHGMLLSHMWRRLLPRLPRKSLTIAAEVTASKGNVILEHLGGWSNTGYLELSFSQSGKGDVHVVGEAKLESEGDTATLPTIAPPVPEGEEPAVAAAEQSSPAKASAASPKLEGWSTTIVAVDSKQHLVGLKRQRGGIGSLAHDAGQKKLDGFFSKRQKTS